MAIPPPSEKQARIIWTAVTGAALALIVALVVALVWGLGRVLDVLAPVLWPLAIAGVLAYLLDPVVDWLERRRVPRVRGVVMVFVLAVLLLVGLLGSVVPQVVVELRQLASNIPGYAQTVERKVSHLIKHPPSSVGRLMERFVPSLAPPPPQGPPAPEADLEKPEADPDAPPAPPKPPAATNLALIIQLVDGDTNRLVLTVPPTEPATPSTPGGLFESLVTADNLKTATAALSRLAGNLASWLLGQAGRVTSFFGVFFGIVAGVVLIPIYLFFLLLEKRGIASTWTQYLPVTDSSFKEELVFVLRSINDYLIAFFRGQVLVAICDGIMYTIGFMLIGLPYAVLIGMIATCLTIIPFIGAFVTVALALIVALVQFGDWQHPALVLLVFAVVQTLEGLVVQPKIMGDRVGLHPMAIIIALVVGTTLLGGLLGGILAIPLAAALRVLMFRYVWRTAEAATPARDKPATQKKPGAG